MKLTKMDDEKNLSTLEGAELNAELNKQSAFNEGFVKGMVWVCICAFGGYSLGSILGNIKNKR